MICIQGQMSAFTDAYITFTNVCLHAMVIYSCKIYSTAY